MSLWTIEVNGVTRTPDGWGIDADSMQFSFLSWQADSLSFTMTEESALAAPPFAYRNPVTVYKDGVKWFVGRVTKPSASAEGPKEIQTYVVKNAWNDLENLTWEQRRNTRSPADNFAVIQEMLSTRAVIGARVGTAGVEKIDTKATITDLLDFAIAEGLELVYDVDFTAMTIPYEEANNLSVAAAMRKAASLMFDATTRWNYATTPPTLIIRRRATATTINLDLLASATNGLASFSRIEADYELVPSGVELTIVGGVTNPADGLRYASPSRQEFRIVGETVYSGRAASGPDRSLVIRGTIPLAADGTYDTETGLENLAQQIAEALKKPFWNALLNFKAGELPGTFRPGHLTNFLNGQDAWATAGAIVQEVTETPASGLTIVRCGRPPWLSKGTLDEVNARIAAIRNPTNAVANIFPGYSKDDTQTPDVFGPRTTTFSLTGYIEGTTTQIVGTVTFEVTILNRVTCNIRQTAFDMRYLIGNGSLGNVSYFGYDVTEAETFFGGALGSVLGVSTGTYKIKLVANGTLPNQRGPHATANSSAIADLTITLDANP